MIKIKKPELLSPIQDYTSLNAAINNGADAVFFGIKGFNMRAGAKNFTVADLPKIVKIAKIHNVKTEQPAYKTVDFYKQSCKIPFSFWSVFGFGFGI